MSCLFHKSLSSLIGIVISVCISTITSNHSSIELVMIDQLKYVVLHLCVQFLDCRDEARLIGASEEFSTVMLAFITTSLE